MVGGCWSTRQPALAALPPALVAAAFVLPAHPIASASPHLPIIVATAAIALGAEQFVCSANKLCNRMSLSPGDATDSAAYVGLTTMIASPGACATSVASTTACVA